MIEITRCEELTTLCATIRQAVTDREFNTCTDLLRQAMSLYPSAPQPHNLMGVVLEKQGNHALAMKHFRAAWALDPTYTPASQNLTTYGTFCTCGAPVFDLDDCMPSENTKTSQQHLFKRNA